VKAWQGLITVVVVTLVAVGCGASATITPSGQSPEPSGGQSPAPSGGGGQGDLVFAMPFEVASLDPHRANEETSVIALGNIYDTLVQLDPNDSTKYVPRLASAWTINDDSTVFTLTIRDDAKFSTGNPVTADDVKFSLDRLWNLQGQPSFILDTMKSIEVVDPHTVTITLKASDSPFLSKLAFPQVAIVDSKVALANGAVSDATAVDADQAEAFLNKNSIGSGAFILGGYTPNQELILKRNPDYWGDAPSVDRVIMRDVPESTVQRQLLESGDIDIAWTLDFDTAKALQGTPGVAVNFVPSINILYMFFTTKPAISEPLSKPEVRRAIQLAIDYNGILALLDGHGQRPPTTIPVGLLGADTVQPLNENLDEARSLMSAAGYPNGFTVDVPYKEVIRFNVDYKLLMTKVQADLQRIGITINLTPIAPTVFLDNYRAGTIAMGASDWAPDYVDPDDWVGPFWSSKVNFLTKRTGYSNPEVDRLQIESVATSDSGKRIAIYKQLQEIFLQDAAFFTLIQPNFILASRDRVHGYKIIYELRQVDFSKISLT
jgi:peptide/nickel transport system substrate-binding protein